MKRRSLTVFFCLVLLDPTYTREVVNITTETKVDVQSTNYPNPYPHSEDKEWVLFHRYGKWIIDIKDFHIEYTPGCTKDYLEVLEANLRMRRLCGRKTSEQILSTGSNVRVLFHSDDSIQETGFRLTFSRVLDYGDLKQIEREGGLKKKPEENATGETYFTRINSRITLQCPLYSKTNSVIWRGPPNLDTISINGGVRFLHKYNVTGNFSAGIYNLIIKNVTNLDRGRYQCDTVYRGNAVEHDLILELAESLSNIQVYNITLAGTIEGTEGIPLTLQCTVENGNPVPKMILSIRDVVLALDISYNLTYTFTPTKQHDLEYLRCAANNSFFYTEKTFQLMIKVKPYVVVQILPSSTVDEGDTVQIACRNETSDFSEQITWWLNEEMITNQSSQVMEITNVTKSDAGTYICETQNNVGFANSSACLNVRFKPRTINNNKEFKVNAKLGRPSQIRITVSSFPTPSASWMDTSGGKISSLTILQLNKTMFCLESSIVPEKESSMGVYNIKVRNPLGSIALKVVLIGTDVTVIPDNNTCNMFSNLILMCTINATDTSSLQNHWTHSYNKTFIRPLKGNIESTTSTLRITYCDFRDEGIYTCSWTSSGHIQSSFAMVTVRGLPIKSRQQVIYEEGQVKLFLFYYAFPTDVNITWFFKDTRVESGYNIVLKPALVNLDIYGKNITKNGNVSILTVAKHPHFNVRDFSCRIKNMFGNLEATFKEKDVRILTTTQTLCNGLNIPCETDFDKRKNTIVVSKPIIISVAVVVVILISILVVFVVNHVRSTRLGPRADLNERTIPDIEDVYLEICATPTESYQEIADVSDVPNQRLELRYSNSTNSDNDEDSSVGTNESDKSMEIYEERRQSTDVNHEYTTIENVL